MRDKDVLNPHFVQMLIGTKPTNLLTPWNASDEVCETESSRDTMAETKLRPKVSVSETVETSGNTHIYVRLRLDFLALPVSFPSSATGAGLLPFPLRTSMAGCAWTSWHDLHCLYHFLHLRWAQVFYPFLS